MRWVMLIGGVLIAVIGSVWTLQGLNVMGGSAMSGSRTWAVIGPLVVIGGLALVVLGARRARAGR